MLRRRWISHACYSRRNFSSLLQSRLRAASLSPDHSVGSPSGRLFSAVAAGAEQAGRGSRIPVSRRVIHVVLLSLTGGFALSALNDLAIFHGCSSKAIEKASQNREVVQALGEPILRGAWHDASLAVGRRRNTVTCKFPVSGPKGQAILKIKAARTGDDAWFSFLRHNDWDILTSEALLLDEQQQISRVILVDIIPPSDAGRKDGVLMEPGEQEKK